jgi:ligand-binding sensor domain-containing protein
MPITRGKIGPMNSWKSAALAVLGTLACVAAHATPPLSVQRYSLEEGLSQQAVLSITQDADGFMWFGTEDGLNRFDGYEFRQLRHDRGDPHSLPNGWVSSLVASDDGLWIATDGGGVVFRNAKTGQLETPAALRDVPDLQSARALSRDSLGRIWIALRNEGVAIFDPRTGELQRLRHSPTQPNTLSDNSVFAILQAARRRETDRHRHRPRSTAGDEFRRRTRRAAAELSKPGQPLRVRALTEAADGTIWVGTDGGLGRYEPRNDRWRVYRAQEGSTTALPDNRIQTLLLDSQGRLWVGLVQGLAWFDPATESFSSYRWDAAEPRSLPDDYVISLFEDRGGSLWIGTKSGGLAKWNPRTWSFGHTRASAEEGFTDRNITSFAEDLQGRLWIGTFGGGINVVDRSNSHVTPLRHGNLRGSLSDDRVMALLEGSDGYMWVGTDGRRTQPRRSTDPAVGGLPQRPGGAHHARCQRRHEPAGSRAAAVGGHVRRRHLALRRAHAPLREPACRARGRHAPVERPRHGAGARSHRARLDRHRRRRPQRLGHQDAAAVLLQARRQAARHPELRLHLLAAGRRRRQRVDRHARRRPRSGQQPGRGTRAPALHQLLRAAGAAQQHRVRPARRRHR